MIDKLTAQTTAIGAFALALVNMLAAFGLVLPSYLTAPAIGLLNAAALAVVGAIAGIKHLVESKNAAS